MKKVIFVLALSGLVSFGSFAVSTTEAKANCTELKKDGDKKKKKSKKECCSDEKSKTSDKKCCESKKKDEQPK
jgi:hypothetical protein